MLLLRDIAAISQDGNSVLYLGGMPFADTFYSALSVVNDNGIA